MCKGLENVGNTESVGSFAKFDSHREFVKEISRKIPWLPSFAHLFAFFSAEFNAVVAALEK